MAVSFDYTLFIVLLGSSVMGLVSGAMGSFAVLRKQSLLGDAIAHAALPGIALAFFLTWTKSPLILLSGAALAGWLGTILMSIVLRFTALKKDAILGIILSVFFGVGVVLLTVIQRLPTANKSGLNKFLFGNASAMLVSDIILMSTVSIFVFLIMLIFWKEFKIVSFDADFARVMGLPSSRVDFFLTALIVLAIVIGLQTVGVVLMSALVIAPAVSARQWTDRLSLMVALSAVFGATAGMVGAFISGSVSKLPTGPTIVVVVSVFVLISLFFAPNRGLLWAVFRQYRNRKRLQKDSVLSNMLLFSEGETDPYHAHDLTALAVVGRGSMRQVLRTLEKEGLLRFEQPNKWGLTKKGLARARTIRNRQGSS